jgi:hypothetical protein
MSRDLLKRAVTLIKCLNGASWEHEVPQVVIQEIETYLAQPEPEPVAWMWQSDNYATRFSQRIFELFDEADDMRNRHGGSLYPLHFMASPNAKRIAELEQELEIQNKIDVLRKIVLEKP